MPEPVVTGTGAVEEQRVAPLPAYKRLEVARKFMKMRQDGIINDSLLGQRFSGLIEAREPEKTNGAVKLKEAGFHDLTKMLQKLSSGRTLNNYVAKSPTDVLSSVVNTVTTANQNVLARIDLEPIIYNW